MTRPVLLLTGASYYQPGWIEEHWPQVVERCDSRLPPYTVNKNVRWRVLQEA